MAKNIRWQIPFVSIGGTHYRIDIYDEGTFTPVTLTGGTNPFTTSEDDSDDYFAPIRTQSGTIEVCTLMPDGNYITLDDLLPANNIARPVRLLKYANGSYSFIEWQGFLSCEAYSQDYIGIPQILDIPVISVLEAMASVEVDQTKLSGLNTVGSTINQLLEIFIAEAGVSYFTEYYVPTIARGRNIVSKYIDATVLFEQKEYNNENSTTYIVSGLSLRDCLARIATYMGWIVREQGIAIYFMDADEVSGYNRRYRQGQITPGGQVIHRWMPDMSDTSIVVGYMASMQWRGTDHKRTVSQGAKSVEVVAKLEKYGLNISIPEFPYGDTQQEYRQVSWNPNVWQYLLASLNTTPYQTVSLRYFKATLSKVHLIQTAVTDSNISDTLSHRFAAEGIVDVSEYSGETVYSGAMFAKVAFESQQQAAHTTNNGIYIVWLQMVNSQFNTLPIFSISSALSYNMPNGYIKLSTSMAHIVVNYDNYFETIWLTKEDNWTDKILMHIKVGNKYWSGTEWVDSLTKIWVDIEGANFKKNWEPTMPVPETDGYLLPINNNTGNLEIAIYPDNESSHSNSFLCETFFSQLSAEYLSLSDNTLTDRGENHYFRLLGTNFRDEIGVNTDLASMLNNHPSPSLIMNSETEAMTELNYGTDQVPDMRRPEVDLLNRLATYYGAARQRLSLIVAHPTAAPLPLLRLNGISPDTRKYLPLAESRDWQEETCTLTCFETPNNE